MSTISSKIKFRKELSLPSQPQSSTKNSLDKGYVALASPVAEDMLTSSPSISYAQMAAKEPNNRLDINSTSDRSSPPASPKQKGKATTPGACSTFAPFRPYKPAGPPAR